MSYPNSVPEIRIFIKQNGEQTLQIRYICQAQGFTSKWKDIPIVKETEVN